MKKKMITNLIGLMLTLISTILIIGMTFFASLGIIMGSYLGYGLGNWVGAVGGGLIMVGLIIPQVYEYRHT